MFIYIEVSLLLNFSLYDESTFSCIGTVSIPPTIFPKLFHVIPILSFNYYYSMLTLIGWPLACEAAKRIVFEEEAVKLYNHISWVFGFFFEYCRTSLNAKLLFPGNEISISSLDYNFEPQLSMMA